MLKVGDYAPTFCLQDQNDHEVCLENFRDQWVVLYFYPKDNTPGCTIEAVGFTEGLGDFERLDAVVLGVSPDTTKSHLRFVEKKSLKITLLSDPEHEVLEKYGVWKPKKMYGKEFLGVVRSTFIIDPKGKLGHIWSKVKVKGHVEDVQETLREMSGK